MGLSQLIPFYFYNAVIEFLQRYYAEVDFKKHLCDIINHIRYKVGCCLCSFQYLRDLTGFIPNHRNCEVYKKQFNLRVK